MAAHTPHERLERAMWDLFWIPDDVTVVDRPELLLIRCPRPVQMLNTVLRADATPDRVGALVEEAREAHAHTSSRWWVPDTRERAHIENALADGGYAPGQKHEARGVEVARFRARAAGNVAVRAVDSIERMKHCIHVGNEAFGLEESPSDQQLARDLALCTEPGARLHRFVAYDAASNPIASGNMTAFPALRFGFLWGGGTVPSARGRGAYSAVIAARLARALELDLDLVGLYARSTTSAPIVERQGFERWGEMTYWVRANAGLA